MEIAAWEVGDILKVPGRSVREIISRGDQMNARNACRADPCGRPLGSGKFIVKGSREPSMSPRRASNRRNSGYWFGGGYKFLFSARPSTPPSINLFYTCSKRRERPSMSFRPRRCTTQNNSQKWSCLFLVLASARLHIFQARERGVYVFRLSSKSG
jgi:hypothetical protein